MCPSSRSLFRRCTAIAALSLAGRRLFRRPCQVGKNLDAGRGSVIWVRRNLVQRRTSHHLYISKSGADCSMLSFARPMVAWVRAMSIVVSSAMLAFTELDIRMFVSD